MCRGGKLGVRISPARADSPDSPRAHLSRAPTRFHPRASLVKSPRGARLVENRRHARLGDDSGRHTHKIHGALDAAIFFPPGRLGDDEATPSRRLKNHEFHEQTYRHNVNS